MQNLKLTLKLRLSQLGSPLLTGVLALLPIALTIALLVWVGGVVASFLGPGSLIGDALSAIGLNFVTNLLAAYVLGTLALLVCVYFFGLLVQSGLQTYLRGLVNRTLLRLPLIGDLYGAAQKVVGLFDRKGSPDMQGMSAVWVFFGGEGGGTAVLALMPNPAPIRIGDKIYRAVLLPTAPVPIGGGLLYVLDEWIRPAEFGVDTLTSIYLSMGITLPPPYDKPQEKK